MNDKEPKGEYDDSSDEEEGGAKGTGGRGDLASESEGEEGPGDDYVE